MKRFLVIAIFVLCCTQVSARELNVPSIDYPTIQSAIDDANDGDTVIVLAGTYQENIDFWGRAITVQSADPNDPNVVAATIIDGNEPDDPNYGSTVTFKNGEDANSVLSGFTITGGTGSWAQIYWQYKGYLWNRCGGGALCLNSSSPTIKKNVFRDNLAGQGGGIYFYDHSNPVVTENTFFDNVAVKNHGFDDPDPDDPNVYDHGDGGAIVGFQYCDATITNNLIQNNHASAYGGGIHVRQWSNGEISENQILNNDAALGGGIHITFTSSPDVVDNLIENNTVGGLGGGGIYVYYYSEPLIERNIITRNTSTNGAGMAVYYDSAPTIRNNLIYKNNSGAGIRFMASSPTISHNTITANHYYGIQCSPKAASIIENNIITSNGSGYGIYVYTGADSPIIRYNNVWGNNAGNYSSSIPDQTGINGNISVPPGFVAPDSNDYTLNYDSKCINAGDPNYVPQGDETDYEGDSRLLGQCVDMGADEAWPVWNITRGAQYESIQQAINDANDADVLIVTRGTHRGPGNRDIRFKGKAIVVRSIDPNDPDIVAATIIDPNGSEADPHRGFQFWKQEGPDSILDGLTITNGAGCYDGGAIRCTNYSNPTIKNCIITNNLSGGRGGGIHCNYSSPTIINCTITGNIATRGYGGAIACFYDSSPIIANCIITNNIAQGDGHHGGGICCHDNSDALVTNCIVTANSAGHRGGGLYAYASTPIFVNCTVIGNSALEGGGIGSFRESNPYVINCIVRDNIAPDGNQLALINTSRVWEGTNIPTEMTVSFSDIEGGQEQACVDHDCTLHWGDGNIDLDPNFVDPGCWDDANTPSDPNDDFFVTGNYHLLPISDCIDAGDNSSVPPVSTTDIDGEQRIFNDTVDMGADEVVTNPIDLNNDGIVDYLELAVLVSEWLQSGGELQTDFYEDGFIDFADYALFAEQWLWTGGWYQ